MPPAIGERRIELRNDRGSAQQLEHSCVVRDARNPLDLEAVGDDEQDAAEAAERVFSSIDSNSTQQLPP
jgi:hypothetical protein